jgi:hypothetical protein
MKVKINENSLKKIMNSKVGPIVGRIAEKKVTAAVEKSRKIMMQEFEDHPITKEIDSGPNGYNQSGTLGGYGNLFSFIGFEEGMDPLSQIRAMLNKAITIKSMPASHKSMMTQFVIELPSKEEVFSETPNPWASGRSWAKGIEQGMSGFGEYLNTMSFKSRSGEGIQADKKIRSGSFSNTKYLSNILNGLERNIKAMIK